MGLVIYFRVSAMIANIRTDMQNICCLGATVCATEKKGRVKEGFTFRVAANADRFEATKREREMATCSFVRNKYWVLRHGKSIPNERGLIVSSMENGTLAEYQLASEGVNQAQNSGELILKELRESNTPLENVRICYSPFARTRHTAEVVASVLNLPLGGPQCKVMEDLRERYFGPSFELESHDKYAEIWALDEKDPFMPPEGGESVGHVASRLSVAVGAMESEFQGCTILIVSHGDPLQILQAILNAAKHLSDSICSDFSSRMQEAKIPSVLSQHRKFALNTGELRRVI